MANITLRKGTPEAPALVPERDPFRMIRDLFGWEPFRDLLPPLRFEPMTFMPAFEVRETPEAYKFLADLPGVKENEVELQLTGNRLTISGKREAELEEKRENLFVHERCYGMFTRTFALPDGVDVDHVIARMENGVLTVVVPKRPEVQPKRIPIGIEKTKV